MFGALLDRRAGFFRFGPANTYVPDQRRYLPGTLVLETTWHTPTGWLTVQDLLVVGPASDERRAGYRRPPGDEAALGMLLRVATCSSGRVEVEMNCLPLFEYGTAEGEWSYDGDGYRLATVRSGELSLQLASSMQLGFVGARSYGRTTLEEGESAFVALSWGDARSVEQRRRVRPAAPDGAVLAQLVEHREVPRSPLPAVHRTQRARAEGTRATRRRARSWRRRRRRSPRRVGGERNWDYRYTWIRDSAFMLRALHDLGFDWEAFEYFAFLLETVTRRFRRRAGSTSRSCTASAANAISRSSTLDHLSGYRGSRPVRIGNGAYDQRQHDVWGMLLDAMATHQRRGGQIVPRVWEGVATLVDIAIEKSSEPDQGIWEMRGDPKHFVASKVMCWVAAERGARIARARDDHERAERWDAAADAIKAEICAKGVDDRGVFTQHYDSTDLDASALLIPIMGFLPADDERVRATVLAVADELTQDGLVLRYRVDKADDGLSNDAEGTFTICSFWLVSALAIIGELDRARALFEKLRSFAGPLLLYAEEIDATTGQHLGNFPQAFTHLALIDAATRLIASEGPAGSVSR